MVLFSLARKGKSYSVKKRFRIESPLVIFSLSHFQGLVPSLPGKKHLDSITFLIIKKEKQKKKVQTEIPVTFYKEFH
jgi:hypothetical protein